MLRNCSLFPYLFLPASLPFFFWCFPPAGHWSLFFPLLLRQFLALRAVYAAVFPPPAIFGSLKFSLLPSGSQTTTQPPQTAPPPPPVNPPLPNSPAVRAPIIYPSFFVLPFCYFFFLRLMCCLEGASAAVLLERGLKGTSYVAF